MTKLNWTALAFALTSIAMLVFAHWALSRPFTLASLACSGVGIRNARRQKKVREELSLQHPAWLPSLKTSGARQFEPFCECPGCGIPTYHLFGPEREQVDTSSVWKAGPGHVWVESDEDIRFSVWNHPGTYRVNDRRTGKYVTKKRVTMVVDRECLSCGKTWVESTA